MPRARYRGAEHQVVTFTDHAEWVLRNADGNVLVLEDDHREDVEVQCERCGRWSPSLALAETGRWVCAHRTCYDHEESRCARAPLPFDRPHTRRLRRWAPKAAKLTAAG
jgi:hypothetical protein